MPLLKISDVTIRQAAACIVSGGIVAFPTETVYGLGADAFNPTALAMIFEIKNRPHFDPLIVHIAALNTLEKVVDLYLLDKDARKKLDALTEKFWPGPLTLILPKQQTVPDLATGGLPTVALRLPSLASARQLIALSGGAVAAPSANPFGCLSPTSAEHVQAMLGDKIEIILDGGQTQVGLESTVLDICNGQARILRPGGVPKEAIESLIGPLAESQALNDSAINNADIYAAVSPGMMKSHYAPKASLEVHDLDGLIKTPIEKTSAFLFFDGASHNKWQKKQKHLLKSHESHVSHESLSIKVLSETGNITEAAARFFQSLHELDKPEISRIYAQFAPKEGLGAAINDRLQKASHV
ncbi:MAG: threonylcarbamoyl-AMP synthase [Treponema sp.]|jgi:L-threonylcarbamoyladenylate synthase|nr:threonylcarbamoyl-AMP synthase [Treponema sp.]